jgi:flavin-dependent dehydrogenase
MATPDKVIVAGGGVGGLALALMLRRAGAEVEVHERHDGLQGRATGFTVWSYAIKRLLDAGLERERLDSIASELEATEIRTQEGEKKAEDVVKSSRRMQHLATLHSPILAWVRNEAFQHVPPEKLEEIAGQPAGGD